ncbi:hypothetical protein PoB_001758300 [Plakobranchus ocellatus]|uniref:Uncharacterized protein n=1 Tax=Plakobranchus ocellatus TaxID=259542 RepID=A0AAV3Z8W9_9GAST|nr:hypothetical protein PoB_001758300 [Plakobranchus ocellatus]
MDTIFRKHGGYVRYDTTKVLKLLLCFSAGNVKPFKLKCVAGDFMVKLQIVAQRGLRLNPSCQFYQAKVFQPPLPTPLPPRPPPLSPKN